MKKIVIAVMFAVIMGLCSVVVLTAYANTGYNELVIVAVCLLLMGCCAVIGVIEKTKLVELMAGWFGKEGDEDE